MTDAGPALLEAARALAPRVRDAAEIIERDRRMPSELVGACASAGLFRMLVPRALGGAEIDPATMIGVLETIAAADASAGWCVMIGATTAVVSGYLAEDVARRVYGDPQVVTGGAFAPSGRATVVDGGLRVHGRWAFASGCEHCAWLLGGCVILEGERPRMLPNGMPDARMVLFPASAARIVDTWTVSGLRGTGSHDIAVDDLVVPAGQSVSLVVDEPCAPGPLYRVPVFGLLALGIAAVALGTARRAIDELVLLAATKTPAGSRRRLAERAAVQAQVAEAEGILGAARALVLNAVAQAWAHAVAGEPVPLAARARLRLAATHATRSAARATDLMYDAGGGTAVYASSPLQRCFRDVHVATQHTMVAPATYELVGRVLLGLDADVTML